MKEIRKPIEMTDGRYMVSNLGNVLSNNYKRSGNSGLMILETNQRGYSKVSLMIGNKPKAFLVHRLVGFAFIDNPEGYEFINHINRIKTDNRVENLERCTRKMNQQHYLNDIKGNHPLMGRKGEISNAHKDIIATDKQGIETLFHGSSEASRILGLIQTCITACCRGKNKTHGGYSFRYAME